MKHIIDFKSIVTLILAIGFAQIFINDLPLKFAFGFILMLLIGYAFIRNLFFFMAALLLLRPAIDNLLISIRVAGQGLGGAVSLGLFIGIFFFCVLESKKNYRLLTPMVGWLVFLIVITLGGFFMSPDKVGAAKVVLRYLSILAVIVSMLVLIDREDKGRIIAKCMQYSIVIPIIIGAVKFVMVEDSRFYGSFTHPNVFAFFILVVLGIIFFQLDKEGGFTKFSPMRILSFIGILAVLILTETRSAWFAFILMTASYAVFFNRRLIIPGLLLVILLCFTPLVQEKILNAFTYEYGDLVINEHSSLGWRLLIWVDLWAVGWESPIIGHGVNSAYTFVHNNLGAHNDYMRYFVEQGIVGLVAYFAPYFYLLFHAIKNYYKYPEDSLLRKLAGFFICFIPAFLLMSFSDNLASYLITLWYVWGLAGIYFALIFQHQEDMATSKN